MILIAYRHGLRVSELCDLRWDHGRSQDRYRPHPPGEEGHAGHTPAPGRRDAGATGAPARTGAEIAVLLHVRARLTLTTAGFASQLPEPARRLGSASNATLTCCDTPAVSPWRMLDTITRSLQAYFGHKNLQHTMRYAELALIRFKNLWRD